MVSPGCSMVKGLARIAAECGMIFQVVYLIKSYFRTCALNISYNFPKNLLAWYFSSFLNVHTDTFSSSLFEKLVHL